MYHIYTPVHCASIYGIDLLARGITCPANGEDTLARVGSPMVTALHKAL